METDSERGDRSGTPILGPVCLLDSSLIQWAGTLIRLQRNGSGTDLFCGAADYPR